MLAFREVLSETHQYLISFNFLACICSSKWRLSKFKQHQKIKQQDGHEQSHEPWSQQFNYPQLGTQANHINHIR